MYAINLLSKFSARLSFQLVLVLTFLVGFLTATPTFATPLPAVCSFAGGESVTSYPLPIAYSPKTFSNIEYRYRASTGWSVPIPTIIEDGTGRVFFDDTRCLHVLNWDATHLVYQSRDGLRFEKPSSNLYVQLHDDGMRSEFGQIVSAGGRTTFFPTQISNRFGWSTEIRYSATFGHLVEQIDIDKAPQSPHTPVYSWNFYYNGSGELLQIHLKNPRGVSLASHEPSYVGAELVSMTRKGLGGKIMGSTTYTYRNSAPGLGLLATETGSLGGQIEFVYQDRPVPHPAGGTHQQSVVSSYIKRTGLTGDPDIVSTFDYQNPASAQGHFLGFSELSVTDAKQQKITTTVDISTLERSGEVQSIESFDSVGAPINISWMYYRSGGVNNFRRIVDKVLHVNFSSGAASATYRGTEFDWDFQHDRLSSVIYHNQAGFDPSTHSFTNEHPEDNRIRKYEYAPDVPALGLRNRLAEWSEYGTATNEVTFRRRYELGADHLPKLIREWDSEAQKFRDTALSFDSFGNLSRVQRGKGTVEFGWLGPRIETVRVNPDKEDFTTKYSYDRTTGLIQRVTDASGIATLYYFDNFSRLTDQYREGVQNRDLLPLLSVTYNDANRTVAVEQLGRVVKYSVDGFGTARKLSDTPAPGGIVSALAGGFNAAGEVDRISVPEFFSTSSGYSSNELQSVHGVQLGYDETGALSSITPDSLADGAYSFQSVPFAPAVGQSPVVNPQGRTSQISGGSAPSWFSAFSNLSAGAIGTGGEEIRAFTLNLPLSTYVMDGIGNIFHQSKNTLGQTVEVQGSDGVLQRFTYDSEGRTTQIAWPSGRTIRYQHGGAGRLSQVTYTGPTGSAYSMRYLWDRPSVNGFSVEKTQLAAIVGPSDRLDFSYDALGRIEIVRQTHTDTSVPIVRTFRFEHDYTRSQIRQIAYPEDLIGGAATVRYTYDANGHEKRVFASPINHLSPEGLLRTIVSRNASGVIEQADYFNDRRELQTISATSGALLRYEFRAISNNLLVAERVHNFSGGRLQSQYVTAGGHTLREDYPIVDSRPFLRQIVRQQDNNPPTTINLNYDQSGRPLVDAKRNHNVFYNPASGHPALADGIRVGSTQYPWQYDLDSQLTSITGPTPLDNASFVYGPDGEIVQVLQPNGSRLEITRGVLGDIMRVQQFDAENAPIVDFRKFLFGLYYEDTDENSQTTAGVVVFGENVQGEEAILARFEYDVTSQFAGPPPEGGGEDFGDFGASFGGGKGGGEPTPTPTTTPDRRKKKRRPPICGDGIVNGTDQCDGNTNLCPQPLQSSCVNCQCQLNGGPPTRILIETHTGVYDENGDLTLEGEDIFDLLYAVLTQTRQRYAKLYEKLGVPLESNGPCDTFSLTTSERTRPDIVTADLIVLQLVAHELAQEIGLTAVMDECSEEQLVPEYEEVPETGGGWLSGIQTTLDVGGIADPTPICDGINCVLYLVQFDFSNAGISAIAFIPYLGDAAKSTRLGGKVCHTVSGGTKLAGRAAMRISGYVLRVVVRYIPTGAFKIAYPNKLKMILGRFPHYRDIGEQGGHLFFDMADEWKTVTAKFGDDMGTAINRDALDIVAPLAQAGHVDIPLVLNPGETLFDLFARKGGNGTKGEIFYLAERYGLNVAEDGAGGLCFRTGTRAVDSGGVPLYLKQQFPEIDWGAYSRNNFPGLGERYVPRHLKARIMNGDWLKNIEQIRGLIR